ncbi:MAG: proton-conducting transporter membrane subunit [bacterium]
MEWIYRLLPETWLFINILFLLGTVALYKNKDELYTLYNIFLFSLIILVLSCVLQIFGFYYGDTIDTLDLSIGKVVIYSNGVFEVISKLVLSMIGLFIGVILSNYFSKGKEEYRHRYFRPDTLPLYFMVILGCFVLISASDFLTFLIGFELVAIPSYFMIAMDNKNPKALEGSIKYFLIGSLATISIIISILLFYIYTGSLYFDKDVNIFRYNGLLIGYAFLIVGILIKLAAFPLSLWIQDAYEGSRTPYLLIISTLPKIAVALFLIKLISIYDFVPKAIVVFSALSMIMGTFFALTSNNIKRILAFSTISNIGYMLIPLVSMTSIEKVIVFDFQALSIIYFYIFQYVLSTILFVSILVGIEEKVDELSLDQLKGFLSNKPVYSFFMIVSLLSLAGLPPTPGFIAKFYLFSYSYSYAPILVWIGIIMSVASLYFYYRIAHVMYLEKNIQQEHSLETQNSQKNFLPTFGSYMLSFLILFMGIFPGFALNVIYLISMSLASA